MSEQKYKQGDRIYFCLGKDKPTGYAKICGVQGFVVIIEPEQPIKDYAYSHIYVVDSQVMASGPEAESSTA